MEFLSKVAIAFEHGGIWMWPILVLQLATFAIIVERVITLFGKRKLNQSALAATFEDPIRRGDLGVVIEKSMAQQDVSALAKATLAGAKAARSLGGRDEIQGKMDEVLVHETGLLDRRTGFLQMLGNVATLMGLLGTIAGMIRSFAAVSFANPAEKAALLSAGISEAMNCTAYGLIVAIPALLGYSLLQNRANLISEDLNHAALKVFNWLSFNYEAVVRPSSARTTEKPEVNA